MASLARITIFPIKSLSGVEVEQAEFTCGGGLQHDRRFAMLDAHGQILNAKRSAALHRLRAEFDLAGESLRLRREGAAWETFPLTGGDPRLRAYLSEFFQTSVTLAEDGAGGFPDDRETPGPTVVSRQSLEQVASWFGLTLEETRRRFRANLEIDADAPFWEDRLFGASEVLFQIGAATLAGMNPCARCVVPSRSPESGEPTRQFAKVFAQRRHETLPAWTPRERFDHFYRLAVNTRVVTPAAVGVGEPVSLESSL